MANIKPIFIGGCPRSGTTLLGALLGAHRECLTTPESQFKIELLRRRDNSIDAAEVQTALKKMLQKPRFKPYWDVTLKANTVSEFRPEESFGNPLEQLVAAYGESVGKQGFSVWVDHTPSNKNYLRTLLAIFPGAKAIHIVRDGRAVAASVISHVWGPSSIIGAAHWWLAHVSLGLAAETDLGKDRIIRIRYEDLVTWPERVLKKLCSWLGLDYDPEMTKGGGYRAPPLVVKRNPLILKEPDPKRAYAWERVLTPRQIEIFENQTMELLPYLGYHLKYGLTPRNIDIPLVAGSIAKELFMGLIKMIRRGYMR